MEREQPILGSRRSQVLNKQSTTESSSDLPTQNELQFVNILGSTSDTSKATKKTVRSHVARFMHQKIRRDRELESQQAKQRDRRQADQRHSSHLGQSATVMPNITSVHGIINTLDAGPRDPFLSGAVLLNRFEAYLLNHFVRIVIPHSAVFYPRSKSEPDYQENMIMYWMPFAITQPAVMNGLFSAACRSLTLLHKTDFYFRAALTYNEKSIQSINSAISKISMAASDNATIVQILMLASGDFLAGNITGSRQHIKGVAELVKLKGGLQNLGLGGFLRQLVLWYDRTSSSYIGTPSNFTHIDQFEANALLDSVLPGFEDPLVLSQLSVNIANILNNICAYNRHVNNLSLPWDESEHRDLVLGVNEFEVLLLALGSDYQNPLSPQKYTSIEECLFLSLRVFIRMMPHEFSFPPMGCKHLAGRMRSVLLNIMLLPWHHFSGLLLWMAFMGSIVARAGEVKEQDLSDFFAALRKQADISSQFEGVEDGSSFWILKLIEISSAMGASCKEDIKLHLKQFLWVDSLCEPYAQDVWSSFEAMQIVLGADRKSVV